MSAYGTASHPGPRESIGKKCRPVFAIDQEPKRPGFAKHEGSKPESLPSGLVLLCTVLRRFSQGRMQDVTRICPQGKYAWATDAVNLLWPRTAGNWVQAAANRALQNLLMRRPDVAKLPREE